MKYVKLFICFIVVALFHSTNNYAGSVSVSDTLSDPATGLTYLQGHWNDGSDYTSYSYDPFAELWKTLTSSPFNSKNNGDTVSWNGRYIQHLGVTLPLLGFVR